MEKTLTEKQVLKQLDIKDFQCLSKDKVIKMASIIDKMEPEVAKKALEQFPEFANTAKEMLVEYKGEYTAIREMRKQIAWYIKGMPNATNIRNEINKIEDLQELEKRILEL